jgi:hypothetical protein
MELDYEPAPENVDGDRRDLTGSRTLTLFLFYGDPPSLDQFQSQIQLREHDVIERYSQEEVRGVLTHLRKIDPLQIENKFRQFMETKSLTKLKCLLLPIYSPKALQEDLLKLIDTAFQEIKEGELKTLSI